MRGTRRVTAAAAATLLTSTTTTTCRPATAHHPSVATAFFASPTTHRAKNHRPSRIGGVLLPRGSSGTTSPWSSSSSLRRPFTTRTPLSGDDDDDSSENTAGKAGDVSGGGVGVGVGVGGEAVSMQQQQSSTSSSSSSSRRREGERNLSVRHFPSVGSTQDECKRLIREGAVQATSPPRCLAVTATEQLNGRGTNDRTWIGARGNTFVTVAFPVDGLPVPPTLLPIRVGTIVACRVMQTLRSSGAPPHVGVTLKWPNDVLVAGKKIAGVLIETESDAERNSWFVVGVGVNVGFAPRVDSVGPHRGRPATCLREHRGEEGYADDGREVDDVEVAGDVGVGVAQDLSDWLVDNHGRDRDTVGNEVVAGWENWGDWELGREIELRDSPTREVVVPVGIQPDGQLKVRGRNGKERLLSTEYLL